MSADPYPCRDEVFYGRGVWPLGEDGDRGLMAEGHGRRALAAMNAHERSMRGYTQWSRIDGFPGADEKWAVIAETCGCTAETHEGEHAVHYDGLTTYDCDCEFPGLPPCDPEMYGWAYTWGTAETPGAVAVTVVDW